MKNITYLLIASLLIACTTEIKNKEANVEVESGTKIDSVEEVSQNTVTNNPQVEKEVKEELVEVAQKQVEVLISDEHYKPLLGFWVGYFEKDDNTQSIFIDDAYFWDRENKINISIDQMKDTLVIGHSVVAGNDRPFKGVVKIDNDGSYSFQVKEPGDDKYDGKFRFVIKNNQLIGKWTAYKNIGVKKRKYTLEKKTFTYNPDIQLERAKAYVNWNKVISTTEEMPEEEEDENETWVSREFGSATDLIYKINASNKLLSKEVVENLKKGDLIIIRNTIYARHGYSFKNRPLRVFFDAQSWYIPVHTKISNDFTELEKQNIKLLLQYEQNAEEYYDYFGRG